MTVGVRSVVTGPDTSQV